VSKGINAGTKTLEVAGQKSSLVGLGKTDVELGEEVVRGNEKGHPDRGVEDWS